MRKNKIFYHKPYISKGFTIIELMSVLVLVAALLAWGVPAYNSYLARKKADAASELLINSIRLAKSEAMTIGRNVGVCAKDTTGTACVTNQTDWSSGWLVYVQNTGADSVARVVQVYQPSGVTITGVTSFTISPSGMASSGATPMAITVKPVGDSGVNGKKINVSVTANISITDGV